MAKQNRQVMQVYNEGDKPLSASAAGIKHYLKWVLLSFSSVIFCFQCDFNIILCVISPLCQAIVTVVCVSDQEMAVADCVEVCEWKSLDCGLPCVG